jgi:hypothetical protein
MKKISSFFVFMFLFAGVSMAVIESCEDRGGSWNKTQGFFDYSKYSSSSTN